ncbi:MAG: hypothetical protein K1X82_01490 [Bacteroidia bacterium]|nr:hypothetical protein [Bacteroidia bacterium]
MIKRISLLAFLFLSVNLFAQDDDLLKELEATDAKPVKEFSLATFKTTRIINTHSIESLGKRAWDLRLSHRFGDFKGGFNQFFGLDGNAPMKIAAEFSIDGRLTFGVGRTFFNSSYGKLWEGFAKYRILRQTTDNKMPLSMTIIAGIGITQRKPSTTLPYEFEYFTSRMSYFYQLAIGRKFSKALSFQVSPMLVHKNLVEKSTDKNDIWALSLGGRWKFSRSVALTAEYTFRLNKYTSNFSDYHNSAGIGVDIETGGHVFQVFIINSHPISELQFISDTRSSWTKGDIRLGFNMSRVFAL